MNPNLLMLMLIIVASATALNLFLTFRVARIVLPELDPEENLVPLVGQSLPAFTVERRAGGDSSGVFELSEGPAALIFLSPACPACRAKVAELAEMLPATEKAGVAMWITGADVHYDIAALTAGSPLAQRTIYLHPETLNLLNPLSAAPVYIFIDEAWAVRAGNYMGDENWQTFVKQMLQVSST